MRELCESYVLPPPPPLRRHESDITRGKVGGSGAWQHRCAASGKKKHFYGATIRSDRSSIIGNCPFVPSASSSTSFFSSLPSFETFDDYFSSRGIIRFLKNNSSSDH